jgi:RNA polymerase sigma factor (TIGR02999 family)
MEPPPAGEGAPPAPGEITSLLGRWQRGDREAFDALAPLVYGELKRLARASLRGHSGGATLQPTALVHEVVLRLLGRPSGRIADRRHFFALAAKILRQVLVDQARERGAKKRGGGAIAVELSTHEPGAPPRAVELLDLDRALGALARRDPQLERLVELRFFGGLTIEESSTVLARSEAALNRDWATARAFLFRELTQPPPEASARS